jgi:AcrR family transcriptional regulator
MLQTREVILDAAISLFSKRPYHMVGMDDIAKMANVAKGTLYYHFSSKEDLYIAMLQEGIEKLLYELKIESSGNVIDDLRLFINRLVEFFVEKREFCELLRREEGKLLSKRLKDCYEKTCSVKELLQSILKKGLDSSLLKDDIEINIVVEIIIGMIKSAIEVNTDKQKLSETIFNILATGIMKK